ncbi:hypothetical protein DFQ30_005131, partial [Apophysomyces sp. BC1015]
MYITKHGFVNKINETHSFYDPLHFVLLFPYGDLGWTFHIPHSTPATDATQPADEDVANEEEGIVDENEVDGHQSRSRQQVTVREYYAFMLQMR